MPFKTCIDFGSRKVRPACSLDKPKIECQCLKLFRFSGANSLNNLLFSVAATVATPKTQTMIHSIAMLKIFDRLRNNLLDVSFFSSKTNLNVKECDGPNMHSMQIDSVTVLFLHSVWYTLPMRLCFFLF